MEGQEEKPVFPFGQRLGRSQSWSGPFGEEENLLTLFEI
jgi:hypothetical protein